MNYKNILLSFLLAQFSLCLCNNTEIQTQEFEENIIKKETELLKLGKEIEQQEELLISMFNKMINAMNKMQHSLKNEEEKKQFSETIINFENNFDTAMLNRDIQNFIINELFNIPMNNKLMMRRIKSIIVRYNIELRLLKRLIKKYENELRELIELDQNS